MSKFKNGKLYVAHTYNATYIGRYNAENDSIENVWGINIKGSNIEIIPPIHPAFLQKKFENRLLDIEIPISAFLVITDLDKIEFGEDLIKVYHEASSGLIIDGGVSKDKSKKKPTLSNEEIAEKIKKATEEKESNQAPKILQV